MYYVRYSAKLYIKNSWMKVKKGLFFFFVCVFVYIFIASWESIFTDYIFIISLLFIFLSVFFIFILIASIPVPLIVIIGKSRFTITAIKPTLCVRYDKKYCNEKRRKEMENKFHILTGFFHFYKVTKKKRN